MIQVLIADDSTSVRLLIQRLIEAEEDMQVIAQAKDGSEAWQLTCKLQPDVVAMDIHMPGMDGYTATKKIMRQCPTPIVIVSSLVQNDCARETFMALEAGAVAAVPKPGYSDIKAGSVNFLRTLREAAAAKVMPRSVETTVKTSAAPTVHAGNKYRLVVVGSSTGGPVALQQMLQQLPPSFPLPIVVVQHISPGFIAGMVDWLQKNCRLTVTVATAGEKVQPRHVYFAPDNAHMGIDNNGVVIFNNNPPLHSVRPAVSYLFSSSGVKSGTGIIAVLLTGMGRDGAQELLDLHRNGAVTLLQDEASCVVYGMPGWAAKLGAGDYHLPPDKIGQKLIAMATG